MTSEQMVIDLVINQNRIYTKSEAMILLRCDVPNKSSDQATNTFENLLGNGPDCLHPTKIGRWNFYYGGELIRFVEFRTKKQGEAQDAA